MKTSNRNTMLMAALLLLTTQDVAAFTPYSRSASSCTTTTTTTTLFARDPQSMRVAEIKAELKTLRVGFGDCFDKESLVTRLEFARSNPPPPPPPPRPEPTRAAASRPPPRPSSRVEFGAESDMNSDVDMDVFAQAGWTGEERRKGTSAVDHDRSPGLNRNFDELSTDDFKQSYRG
ncbi:unnamed protein product [Cylindrotheca closterium]|uniref:Uncharacterized protein n=1 Tax=Cylindrotheca closterium TaxID=2856 RepID=A0AAD2CU87_9STRA|nr:unnamed protein product [Cylindrotheca closterium]